MSICSKFGQGLQNLIIARFLNCFSNPIIPVCSMSILLRVSQLKVVLAVFQNEVSTISEEEKMELEVESI